MRRHRNAVNTGRHTRRNNKAKVEAAGVRLPLAASSLIVSLYAIFRAHAHGAEMPETASGLAYGIGFMLAMGSCMAAVSGWLTFAP